MNERQIQEMIEDTYEQSKEDTLRGMIKDFYNRKNASSIVIVWAYAAVIIALATWAGVRFFKAEQTQTQMMYAVIFIVMVQFMQLIKIFAWQMIHRNGIKREIKRLEIRIAELSQTIKG